MTTTDTDATTPAATTAPKKSATKVVLATVLLSLLWPLLQIAAYGSFDALLGVGVDGPAREAIQAEVGDLALTDDFGHDGQQFYVISRNLLDPKAAEDSVSPLAYRYRRILYPAVGSVLAPNGGRQLIAVFLLESLAGVAIGAWALTRFPCGPRWLPLTVAFTPGVIAAMGLSLSDALACGLALLAVALSFERRWWPMIGVLVLAALTRETALLVAAGLVLTPGMPRRIRAATAAVPLLVFGAWAAWSSHAAAASSAKGGADQLSFPFGGWLSIHVPMGQRLLLLTVFALMAAGAWRSRKDAPHIAAILAMGAALLACISDLVAFNWVNSMRPIAPMVPLALWSLFRSSAAKPDNTMAQDRELSPP